MRRNIYAIAFWKASLSLRCILDGDSDLTQDWVVDNSSVTYFRSQLERRKMRVRLLDRPTTILIPRTKFLRAAHIRGIHHG